MTVKDRGSALEGFFALYDGTGNPGIHVASPITCKVKTQYELVKKWQIAMRSIHRSPTLRGNPLGKLPELYPFDLLKRPLVEEATEFVRQIGTHHWEPTTSLYEFEVWGPYTEKVGEAHDWIPEEDNQFIPKHDRRVATTAWGYSGNELPIRFGCVFMIRGLFQRASRYGHVDEQTGVIIV